MAIVGIDLGTTMSCIARLDEMGKPIVIPNSEGDLITPSVVLFEDKKSKVVGKVAKQSAVAYADRVVEYVKNEMGRTQTWSFFGDTYTPEDISAIILRRLKEDAEQVIGETIDGVVITVPAIFGDAERNATKTAGQIAGLNVLALLEEPVAAALAYGFGKDTGNKEVQNVLVYDLGGGTFDITVMQVSGDNITMLATDGDRRLGGRDWDDRIIDYIANQFEMENGINPREDLESFQDLRNRAEDAKKTLSRKEQTRIVCHYAGKSAKVDLSRAKFVELTADLLAQTESTTESVIRKLRDSDKLPGGWSDLHHVLLVGGSTRMPQVPEMLKRISGKDPEMLEVDAVVAQGAALYSVMKAIRNAEEKGTTSELEKLGLPVGVEDLLSRKEVARVCSFALGVIALHDQNEENSIIIERNSPVPVKQSRMYGTIADNQSEIRIVVLDGEHSDPALCQILGEGLIERIPPGLPKGSPVEVTYEMDDESMVRVTAVELTHNSRLEMTLKRESGKTEAQVETARARLAQDSLT